MTASRLEKILRIGGLTVIATGGAMALIPNLDICYSLSATSLGLAVTTIADNYMDERLKKLRETQESVSNYR